MSAIEHPTQPIDGATSPAVPTTPDAAPRDLRRTWRRLAAASLILGPLGVTLIRTVMPYWTNDSTAEMVAGMAAAPGRAAPGASRARLPERAGPRIRRPTHARARPARGRSRSHS